MKEVGSLGEVHGSQFSYSLLCKSLKFYTKPWFFLMAIYAIAITTYSYVINMCVFAHAFSRGGVPGHRSSGSDFNPCSSHGEDQQGSEVHQLIQLCSYAGVWTHLDFLGLWNGSCCDGTHLLSTETLSSKHYMILSIPYPDPNHCSVPSCSCWVWSLQSETSERSQECG